MRPREMYVCRGRPICAFAARIPDCGPFVSPVQLHVFAMRPTPRGHPAVRLQRCQRRSLCCQVRLIKSKPLHGDRFRWPLHGLELLWYVCKPRQGWFRRALRVRGERLHKQLHTAAKGGESKWGSSKSDRVWRRSLSHLHGKVEHLVQVSSKCSFVRPPPPSPRAAFPPCPALPSTSRWHASWLPLGCLIYPAATPSSPAAI